MTPPAHQLPAKAATTAANIPGPETGGETVMLPGSTETPATSIDRPKAGVPPNEIAGWGTAVDPDGDCLVNADGRALAITIPPTLHDLNAAIGLFIAPRVVAWRRSKVTSTLQVRVVGDFGAGQQVEELAPE